MAQPRVAPVLDARLRYLMEQARLGKSPQALREEVPVTLRFVQAPDAPQLAELRQAGVRFHPGPGNAGILRGRTVIPAMARVDQLERLARRPELARIETSWSPARVAPLYRTRAMVGAEQAWTLHDGQSRPLLGQDILIADIDSGVDVFHPDFWRADGATHAWLDLNANNLLNDGDAVDLDDDGGFDPGETVRWLDAPGGAPGQAGTQNPTIDHVYVDANGNGLRDFGPPSFSESDPTFGELVLRPQDLDSDLLIEPGEPLVAMQTCKVKAIFQTDDVVRRLGVDLISNEGDLIGHGTNVGGILAGGEPGRRFGGLAPAADLIFANLSYGEDPPYVTPLDVRMAWAVAEGAEVIVYEDGEWIWLFMDGSNNVELLMNEYAEQGVLQVVAAGNLATGSMHWQQQLGTAPGDSVVAQLVTASPGDPVTLSWGDFLWIPGPADSLEVTLRAPNGQAMSLGGSAGTTTLGDYDVYTATDASPRGTVRVDFGFSLSTAASATQLDGTWRFTLRRVGAGTQPLRIHGYAFDNRSSWFGSTTWTDTTMASTVTWPATADSAISVAAYNPATVALNNFSGRGPRIDGREAVDVTAPGTLTYAAQRNQDWSGVAGGYRGFGGTSAATPHVAAACALLRQWNPYAGHGEIRRMLRQGAVVDAQTGSVPNVDWGYGKLQIYQSALVGPSGAPDAGMATRVGVPLVRPNTPNPFNPSTLLRFVLPHAGRVSVELLDARGRRVVSLRDGFASAGEHAVRWDGRDGVGRPVASGVYVARITLDGRSAARTIALVR